MYIPEFNFDKLYQLLNDKRKRHGFTWNKVATRAGVTPSGLNSFIRAYEQEGFEKRSLALDSVVSLMIWLNVFDLREVLLEEEE